MIFIVNNILVGLVTIEFNVSPYRNFYHDGYMEAHIDLTTFRLGRHYVDASNRIIVQKKGIIDAVREIFKRWYG